MYLIGLALKTMSFLELNEQTTYVQGLRMQTEHYMSHI